ncbi:putative sugar kinase ydjH [Bacteroidales bacterium Barb6XT]|nr:putative sugar kinase ydjH [Bacteroidales bacterium Barb6XT]
MRTIGLGNALVDILLQLESDSILQEIGIQKGAMDMISEEQMTAIRKAQEHREKSRTPGGSVCNSMRAMSYLGAASSFIGKIGSDSVGEYYEEAVRKAGVTPYFIKTEGISGSCTVLISPDGERSMGTFLGPAATITPEEIGDDILHEHHYLYIEGYLVVNESLMRGTMQKAKSLGLKVALDLSNFNIVNAFKGLLENIIPQYVDILFSNEYEAKAFTGLEAEEAVLELARIADIAVVTLGKRGALIACGNEVVHVEAEGRNPIDTTGAGDYFAAGFLYGQTVGATPEQSGRIGSLLSKYVIDTIGPEIPEPHWEPIRSRVKEILTDITPKSRIS